MKTINDNFEFQDAHQDYFPIAISTDNTKSSKQWLAWSAIFPMTEQGSWLTVFYNTTTSRSIHIEYGKMVLFRSDVVHCGGRPETDTKTNQSFYRLHFYLQTKDQKAPENKINKYYLDGRTFLNDMYQMPIEKQRQIEAEEEKNIKKNANHIISHFK